MLQRSPSYVFSIPAPIRSPTCWNRALGYKRASKVIRRKNVARPRGLQGLRGWPRLMRKLLIGCVRMQVPATRRRHLLHAAIQTWGGEQWLAIAQRGSVPKAISAGKASVVTDRIDWFTRTGIPLELVRAHR